MNHYFDHNATTPMSGVAKQAWLAAEERHWHNPSSLYREAGFAKQRLEEARERLAALLGCDDAERIVFTSGATESNNALFASLSRTLPPDAVVAVSEIEHPSVREAAAFWFRERVVTIPVDAKGVVRIEDVMATIGRHEPALVSVMAASNESGALQRWREIATVCRDAATLFHCDAAQWIGKMPCTRDCEGFPPSGWGRVEVLERGAGTSPGAAALEWPECVAESLAMCDFVTGSAHKFGGPKGCGFLLLPWQEEKPLFLLRGGPQENGRRAGTENYPAVEAMVCALEEAQARLAGTARLQMAHRDEFERVMQAAFPGLRIISGEAARLWNTCLLVMPWHENLKWLTRLTRRGFAISTGSACSSGREGSSAVVRALGASEEELRRVVRVSGGPDHASEDWRALADAFAEVGQELDAGGKG